MMSIVSFGIGFGLGLIYVMAMIQNNYKLMGLAIVIHLLIFLEMVISLGW